MKVENEFLWLNHGETNVPHAFAMGENRSLCGSVHIVFTNAALKTHKEERCKRCLASAKYKGWKETWKKDPS